MVIITTFSSLRNYTVQPQFDTPTDQSKLISKLWRTNCKYCIDCNCCSDSLNFDNHPIFKILVLNYLCPKMKGGVNEHIRLLQYTIQTASRQPPNILKTPFRHPPTLRSCGALLLLEAKPFWVT